MSVGCPCRAHIHLASLLVLAIEDELTGHCSLGATTARQKGQRVTCVFCRANWTAEGAGAGVGRRAAAAHDSYEGYVNLADVAGVSTARDTSSCTSPSMVGRAW